MPEGTGVTIFPWPIRILEAAARDILDGLIWYPDGLPETAVYLSRDCAANGTAGCVPSEEPYMSPSGQSVVNKVLKVSLYEDILRCGSFGQAFAVYAHELLWRNFLDSEGALRVLEALEPYWAKLPGEQVDLFTPYYVVCELVRRVSSDGETARDFKKGMQA